MHLRKVSPQYIIHGQFVGVNKPSRHNAYRYHCAEGLALQCFSFHLFLLIYHPYPTSFHEMIFILVLLIFLVEVNLERQGTPKMLIHAYIRMHTHYADHSPAE